MSTLESVSTLDSTADSIDPTIEIHVVNMNDSTSIPTLPNPPSTVSESTLNTSNSSARRSATSQIHKLRQQRIRVPSLDDYDHSREYHKIWRDLCMSSCFFVFMYALPISEAVIYSMKESGCDVQQPISLPLYLLVACIVDFVQSTLLNVFICMDNMNLVKQVLSFCMHFWIFWVFFGFVSLLGFNNGDVCKQTHLYRMSFASLIIRSLCLYRLSKIDE